MTDTTITQSAAGALHAAILNIPCVLPPSEDSPKYLEGMRLGHRDARHAAAELVAALSATPQAPAEPTLYQYRMRPGWRDPAQWQAWSDCSAASAADYERTPLLHNWHYEVRRLYATPPAPSVQAKPLDDPRLQKLFSDAITGALAFGAQNSNPPPPGHWLQHFWDIGRAEGAAPSVQAEPDMLAICTALGFDPTNHHNAAKCPYCRPSVQASQAVPSDAATVAAELKRLIGRQINYPGTPRSAAWAAEVFAKIDALASPAAQPVAQIDPLDVSSVMTQIRASDSATAAFRRILTLAQTRAEPTGAPE